MAGLVGLVSFSSSCWEGYFRFTGLDWDGNQHLHPDERFLTGVATSLESTDPISYLKTSESTLNPYNERHGDGSMVYPLYVYGNFPMSVTRLIAEAMMGVCRQSPDLCDHNYTAYDGIQIVGRFLSASVDLISILFIFLIGKRLYNQWVGLIAALLLASAVMPIQQSHFFTMDNWAAMFSTLTIYFAVRASQDGGRFRWWLAFGIGLGLALASRINVLPLAGMSAIAGFIWLENQRMNVGTSWKTYLATSWGWHQLQRVIVGGLLAGLLSLLVFRVAQPYAFMDRALAKETAIAETGFEPSPIKLFVQGIVGLHPQFMANMAEIQRLQAPEASFPPALQWTDRAPILFPLTNMVLYGMGLTAGITAWLGFCWALWRVVRSKSDCLAHLLPLIWSGGYFLFIGVRWVKSIRYFLPIYPTLLLLAAWALWQLWEQGKASGKGRLIAGIATTIVIIPTILWANAFVQIYRQPVTRVTASRWILENIPSGATLLYEVDGEARRLQLPLRGYDMPVGSLPLQLNFTMPEEGMVTGVRFNFLSDPDGGDDREQLSIGLLNPNSPATYYSNVKVDLDLEEARQPILVPLDNVTLPADLNLKIVVQNTGTAPIYAGSSIISNEHWDDSLPTRVDGKDPYSQYFAGISGGQMSITHPGSYEKIHNMVGWLDEADVIVLSSQRSLWNTPRLPLTYPVNIRYYEALFNGELGFELATQFHADLHIGPLYISDTTGQLGWGKPPDAGWPPPNEFAAEEAFSVYDHPPVWIFRKTNEYSSENSERIFSQVNISQQRTMNPAEATNAPNGLLLSDQAKAVQRSNGTFSKLFDVDGILASQPAVSAVVWWIAVVLLGWLFFPLSYTVFAGISTRGYGLSRILALLLISYFGWLLASLNWLPNSRETYLLGLGLFALLNGWLFWRNRTEIRQFLREKRAYIGMVEAVTLFLYILFLMIRLGNPDVWDVIWGGEKPMDMSYFNAVLKSTTFPPYDPWFSDGYINYYYYGFVYVGSLTKLLGVVPAIAYNLIIPMLYSFTGMGAFALAYNFVWGTGKEEGKEKRHWRGVTAGITAMALAVLLGNLAQFGVMTNAWERSSDSPSEIRLVRMIDGALDALPSDKKLNIGTGDWFWTASRAINIDDGETHPITEFPYFTFLYGDLHAHMIAMPLMLLALGWVVSLTLQSPTKRRSIWQTSLQWLVGGLAIGVLRATNTWDLPTYLGLGALAALYAAYRRNGALSFLGVAEGLIQSALLAGIALLTFMPFSQNYGVGYSSPKLWDGSYTYVGNYFAIYGLFLFILLTFMAVTWRRWARSWTQDQLAQWKAGWVWMAILIIFYLATLLWMLWQSYWIAPMVLTIVLFAGILSLRTSLPHAQRVVLALTACAFALTLAVEIVVLEGDIGRMNTVFKVYMQVWLILSVVAGASLAWLLPAISWRRNIISKSWVIALAVLVGVAMLYPITATKAKWDIRMSKEAPLTLDGMAFMQTTEYGDHGQIVPLNYDYEAIKWMQANIEGSPVIAEGHSSNPYRSIGNRVAMYTGLPAVIGWDWHQRQQRAVLEELAVSMVTTRINDINNLYNTPNIDEALIILDKYDVAYIYVGQLEWVYYSPVGMSKFDQMIEAGLLEEVYRNEGTSIYRVDS